MIHTGGEQRSGHRGQATTGHLDVDYPGDTQPDKQENR